MTNQNDREQADGGARSLVDALLKRTGKVAGGTLDLAMDMAAVAAMSGDSWLRSVVSSSASPERLQAMAEAGHFLRDARETAGLSIAELSERLGLGDSEVLEGVERGEAILPLDMMLRAASLLARHDPIPFLIKFLRSYNPQLEATLEQWGIMALPRNYERERRFLNLYRQHDFLRDLDDDAHARFIEYMDASTQLVVDVMARERAAGAASRTRKAASGKATAKTARTSRASRGSRAGTRGRGSAPAGSNAKPVVRKVKPRKKTDAAATSRARRSGD
jgi:transcriptional regulator with XRE-family HTH domain